MGGAVIDGGKQIGHPLVANAAFDADGALRGCRREIGGVQQFGDDLGLSQAPETGIGQQGGIHLSFCQLAQTGINKAAIDHHVEIRPQPANQCLSAQR